MFKQALPVVALLALAACEGNSTNPVNGITGDVGADVDEDTAEAAGIPETLSLNVSDVDFDAGDPDDPTDDVLIVTGPPLDDSPVAGRYERRPSLDVEGYQAYLKQDDRLSRVFVAVGATSADGSVRAASVLDGGQNNIFFRGNFYERVGGFTRPATTDPDGQVSYAGTYAGLANLDDLGQEERLPLEPGDPDEFTPFQPRQTEGKVIMNVDFSDNSVEGTIYDRQFTDGRALASLALIPGEGQENSQNLDDNGEFTGDIQFSGRPDLDRQGEYGGIIGGADASSMAGVIHLENMFEPEDPLEEVTGTFDREVGTFVLPRCGTETAPEICDGLSDLE